MTAREVIVHAIQMASVLEGPVQTLRCRPKTLLRLRVQQREIAAISRGAAAS